MHGGTFPGHWPRCFLARFTLPPYLANMEKSGLQGVHAQCCQIRFTQLLRTECVIDFHFISCDWVIE